MKRLLYVLAALVIPMLTSCDVHEWPQEPDKTGLTVRLRYETEMTTWEFSYEDGRLTEHGMGPTYDNRLDSGRIRHIVRAYPVSDRQRYAGDYTAQLMIVRDLSEGYDCDLTLHLPAGKYRIMVWSDMMQELDDAYFYDPDNFSEVTLQGTYEGDTDYRDAFRGVGEITLTTSIADRPPVDLEIKMQRPLAKYEFVSTDLHEFSQTNVNLDSCTVIFFYPGFMPDSYDMTSDRPNDVAENVRFESSLERLDANSASLGYDYVFVNGVQAGLHVMVGLYDAGGRQMALSESIQVPLMRNRHTVIKGPFLMTQTSGGVRINPVFDGNYNIVIE
jgi:hypothetical protein